MAVNVEYLVLTSRYMHYVFLDNFVLFCFACHYFLPMKQIDKILEYARARLDTLYMKAMDDLRSA